MKTSIQKREPQQSAEAWEAEHAALTRRVEEIFVAASKRYVAPSVEHCATLAASLLAQRNIAARADRYAELARAKRAAKIFLKHLEPTRQSIGARAAIAEERGEYAGREGAAWVAQRDKIEASIRAVEEMLPVLSEARPSQYDPIRMIARVVQRSWAVPTDGETSFGNEPDSPLVKIVMALLAEVGMMHVKANAVSKILKGLRRTKGQIGPKPRHKFSD